METPDLKKITPEQRKAVSKILFKGRVALIMAILKTTLGLFVANLTTLLFGAMYLKDVDPDMQTGFKFVAIFLNFIFMTRYLDRRVKANSDNVNNEIKDVLKKQGNIDEERV